jgi:hypothetical protein
MTIEKKKKIRAKLPKGSIRKIAKMIKKTPEHVSLVFRMDSYNDPKVIQLALSIIQQTQKMDNKVDKTFKKLLG